jgi:predicted transcriptional regulator of viral defense system
MQAKTLQAQVRMRELAARSGGLMSLRELEYAGCTRAQVRSMVERGELVRLRRGYYGLPHETPDEYAMLQTYVPQSVYSYATALFIWGFIDRVPHVLDISVCQGANVSYAMPVMEDVRFHYHSAGLFGIGITTAVTPQGGTVRVYDRERCLCDLVGARGKMDMQVYAQGVKSYFAGAPKLRTLLRYARALGVEDGVRRFTEVML